MFRVVAVFCIGLLFAVVCAAEPLAKPPLNTIASLDIPRYMGVWHEIAKYPNWFQKKCASNAHAEYSLMADGSIQVTNRCRLQNGEMSAAIGAVQQTGGAASAKLKVRFAPAWLSLIPAVWGDYWVIDLDDAYELVAVSEPNREYLWILSRTAKVEQKVYEALLKRLVQKGFDLGKLEVTRQEGINGGGVD